MGVAGEFYECDCCGSKMPTIEDVRNHACPEHKSMRRRPTLLERIRRALRPPGTADAGLRLALAETAASVTATDARPGGTGTVEVLEQQEVDYHS